MFLSSPQLSQKEFSFLNLSKFLIYLKLVSLRGKKIELNWEKVLRLLILFIQRKLFRAQIEFSPIEKQTNLSSSNGGKSASTLK